MSDVAEEAAFFRGREVVSSGAFWPESTWAGCLLSGWGAPPRSDWARQVNEDRILNQDRIRPFVARGTLLVGIAICLAVLQAPWWALALLGLGAVQTGLEIVFEVPMRAQYEAVALDSRTERLPGSHWIVRVWYWNYERGITNVTGILGLVACSVNILVVLFAVGAATDLVWVKVLAFAGALLYTNSGALGPLMDTSAYSPHSELSGTAQRVVRMLWLVYAAFLAVLIWAAEHFFHSWGSGLPYAFMAIGLSYYPMLRIREFERSMAASWNVAERATTRSHVAVATDLHNILQPVKGTLQAARDALTDSLQRLELTQYIDEVEEIYRAARNGTIDLREGLATPLGTRLKQKAAREAIPLRSTIVLDQNTPPEDYRRAKQCLLAFVDNSVQAYLAGSGVSRPFLEVSATQRDALVVVEVTDGLGLVPDDVWNDPHTTLWGLRADIAARPQGSLTQELRSDGKTIRAQWEIMPLLRVRSAEVETRSAR